MDFSELRRAVEDAWQDLGPGIDLMNLLLIEQMAHPLDSAAWAALRESTVLADPSRIEPAFADLRRYWERLLKLAEAAGVPLQQGTTPAAALEPDTSVLTALLSGLSEGRGLLRDLAAQPERAAGFPAIRAQVDQAWRALSMAAVRQAAVAAMDQRVAQIFSKPA